MCSDCHLKQPSYGTEPGKPLYCSSCASKRSKEEGLRNVKSKLCSDCSKLQPSFGTETGKPLYCASCASKRPKEEGLRNVKCKRCSDCSKHQPSFGTEPRKPLYCASCASKRPKEEGLRNVVNKRCSDCSKRQPSFGAEPGKPLYCASCASKRPKEEGLRDVKNKWCSDCSKRQPSYGTDPGKPLYCASCASKRPKEEGLREVKSKRCITPHCDTRVCNKAYRSHCYRCFIHTFPDNDIVRNHKTKERAVADFIRAVYSDYDIAFDRRVAEGCSRRRPDIFVDMGAFVVVVEIDENQHAEYDCSCENKRLMELFQDAGSRPMAMVRFNPDQYFNQKKKSIASCWGATKDKGLCVVKPNKTAEWAARLATLKTTLDVVFGQGPTKDVDVYHLYYDGF